MSGSVVVESKQPPVLAASLVQSSGHELAQTAAAASEKARIEAAYVMAMHRPRNVMVARAKILEACQRPKFADAAIFSKPVGGQQIEGPSVRLAEEMMRSFGNIHVEKYTVYEDEHKRMIKVCTTDLESNLSVSGEIIIAKTVERRKVKDGTVVIGQRKNSYGDTVFIVEATEDELIVKESAQVSKLIRNNVLRLIPADIQEDAMAEAYATLGRKDAADPKAALKALYDGFAGIGVLPDQVAAYLGHTRPNVDAAELKELRGIFTAIRSGETSWQDCLSAKLDARESGSSPGKKTVEAAASKSREQQERTAQQPSGSLPPDSAPAQTVVQQDPNPPAPATSRRRASNSGLSI